MKSLQNILSGLPVERRAKIEARTEALRQALIEGKKSGEDSPLDMEEQKAGKNPCRRLPKGAWPICEKASPSCCGSELLETKRGP